MNRLELFISNLSSKLQDLKNYIFDKHVKKLFIFCVLIQFLLLLQEIILIGVIIFAFIMLVTLNLFKDVKNKIFSQLLLNIFDILNYLLCSMTKYLLFYLLYTQKHINKINNEKNKFINTKLQEKK
jgi:hypothetical protein